jgi:hypothetical protein
MVRVLEDWVIDEKTGLTALNALSTTYKKSVELAHKSSKAALSLLLVFTAFLGFNSMTGNESPVLPTVSQVETESSPMSPVAPSAEPTATTTAKAQAAATAAAKKAQQAAINAKIAALSFFGLDNSGVPTGFTITDKDSVFGKARVTKGISGVGLSGFQIKNQFITSSLGPNILMDQSITIDGSGTNFNVNYLNVGFAGNWNPVEIDSIESSIERLANGQHLITATMKVGYLEPSEFVVSTGKRGYDLTDAPASITTRILLNPGKSAILAQAVQVMDK